MPTADKKLSSPPPHRHEHRDISIRYAALTLFSIFVLVVAALLLMWGLLRFLSARQSRAEVPRPPLADTRPEQAPEPRLQVNPIEDLQQVRRREENFLQSYSWADAEKGIVRIPISRAMDLLAQRGLPARPGPGGTGQSGRRKDRP